MIRVLKIFSAAALDQSGMHPGGLCNFRSRLHRGGPAAKYSLVIVLKRRMNGDGQGCSAGMQTADMLDHAL